MRVFVYLQFFFFLMTFTFATKTENACSQIKLIGREQWGAKLPKDVVSMKTPVRYVFIHHTAMGECFNLSRCIENMKEIQDLHMISNKWSDIGYNFLVGEDGRVYEARGWNRTGAHTKYYNQVAVAVSVMGNFMERIPNQDALDAVHNIINCGVEKGFIIPKYELFGHRDVRTTDCPGNAFYKLIQKWSHYSHNIPNLHVKTNNGCASLKLMLFAYLLSAIVILVNY